MHRASVRPTHADPGAPAQPRAHRRRRRKATRQCHGGRRPSTGRWCPRRRFQALGHVGSCVRRRHGYTAAALRSVSSERRSFTVVMDTAVMIKLYIMRINAILTGVVLSLSLATFSSATVAATTVVNVLLEDSSSDPAIGNMRIALDHATIMAGRVTFRAMN